MEKTFVEFKIEIPLNVSEDTNTTQVVQELQNIIEENLVSLDVDILGHNIINKEIVYTNFRGKVFTYEKFCSYLDSWMENVEPFASMRGTIYELAQSEIFKTALDLLDGRDPGTIHDMFGKEDVFNVMDAINNKLDELIARNQ